MICNTKNKRIENEEREKDIDFLRGVGIVFMIMGHTGCGNGMLPHFFHAFHMPMFFLISGLLWKKQKTQTFLKKRIRTLLLPYICFGSIALLICWFCGDVTNKQIYAVFWYNTNNFPIVGALWFLTAFFIAQMTMHLICKLFRHESRRALSVFMITMGGYLASINGVRLPYAIPQGCIGLGFVYIGYVIKKYGLVEKFCQYKKSIALIASILIILSIFSNGYVDMRCSKYANVFLFFINAVAATMEGLYWSKYIVDYYGEKCISKHIIWIGQNSIIYLVLNQIVIMFVKKIIKRIPFIYNNLFIYALAVYVSIFVLLYILSVLFNNTPLKILVGKRATK